MSAKMKNDNALIYDKCMKHTSIRIPEYMFDWVERKIGSGQFRSRSDVVCWLIENEIEYEQGGAIAGLPLYGGD